MGELIESQHQYIKTTSNFFQNEKLSASSPTVSGTLQPITEGYNRAV